MQPLRWIGVRSYGIYLWHWPVFMLTRPQLDIRLDGWPLFLLRLLLVAALAELSFRFVETPFRRGRVRSVRAVGAAAAGLVLLTTSVSASKPVERPAYMPIDAVDTWGAATPTVVEATDPPTTAATLGLEPAVDPVEQQVADPAAEPPPDAAVTAEPAAPFQVAASPPSRRLRVTAIGDSVMLGAVNALEDDIDGIEIDAAISRQTSAAIELLRSRSAAGQLGDVVIVHMGNNGVFTASQFDSMMGVLADVPRVVFVNVKVPRTWEAPNDAVIADGVQRYANTILLDWRNASIDRPDFFWDDGIHLRPEGAAAYAELIESRIIR
jgi:hypothetical protein